MRNHKMELPERDKLIAELFKGRTHLWEYEHTVKHLKEMGDKYLEEDTGEIPPETCLDVGFFFCIYFLFMLTCILSAFALPTQAKTS